MLNVGANALRVDDVEVLDLRVDPGDLNTEVVLERQSDCLVGRQTVCVWRGGPASRSWLLLCRLCGNGNTGVPKDGHEIAAQNGHPNEHRTHLSQLQ